MPHDFPETYSRPSRQTLRVRSGSEQYAQAARACLAPPYASQLTSSYFRKANAMIIVYDITSKDSFDDLEGYIKEGTRYSDRSDKFIVGAFRICIKPLM